MSKMVDHMTATAADLAEMLCVTPAMITQWTTAGKLTKTAAGRYPLKASVRQMVKELRERSKRRAGTDDLDAETKRARLQIMRQKIRDWRTAYGAQLMTELLAALTGALQAVRRAVPATPATVQALEAALDQVAAADPKGLARSAGEALDDETEEEGDDVEPADAARV